MNTLDSKSWLDVFDPPKVPLLKDPLGWKRVKISECREKLVPLSTLDPDHLVIEPKYHLQGHPEAMAECYARETVASLLIKAAKALPPRWKIVVFDAWRPLKLQQALFENYKAHLRAKFAAASEDWLNQEAQKYVSLPSLDPTCPSPHVSGGAVDLSLKDAQGHNLDMGTEFDVFDEKSHTRYFEVKLQRDGFLTPQELVWLKNRRILFHVLTRVGFTNYPEEWWHFDYGNQFWGSIKGAKACYRIATQ